jgi:quercetin dioxygenase-like cupin family protein
MRSTGLLSLLAALTLSAPLRAQTDGTCVPIAERNDRKLGCFITARHELGALRATPALYWHIDSFPSRVPAERARKRDARSTVVESLGKTWLFTIAPRGFRAPGARHVARIGPLPLVDAKQFAAVYMEGVFAPGMHSMVHRHPGAEAWLTLEGSQCVETPHGKQVQSVGDPGIIVPGGLPMRLTGTGTGVRRSLVLILQDATQPRSTPATDWTPKNLCGS